MGNDSVRFYHSIDKPYRALCSYVSSFISIGNGFYKIAPEYEREFPGGKVYERGVDLFDTEDELCEARGWEVGYVIEDHGNGVRKIYVPQRIGDLAKFCYDGVEYIKNQVHDSEDDALRWALDRFNWMREEHLREVEKFSTLIGKVEDRISEITSKVGFGDEQ